MRVADNPEWAKILKQKEKEERLATRKASKQAPQAAEDFMAPPPPKGRMSVGNTSAPGGGGGFSGGGGGLSVGGKGASTAGMSDADKASKWKEQSKAFREAMRAARQVTKALEAGEPLPPPVYSGPDLSLIPCPHCGRRFNEKAAERHIPQCNNIRAKPSSLKKGTGGAGGTIS